MSTQKIVLGFLGGIAAGAALGLLFAPQSGKKTRRALMRKGERTREDLREVVTQAHAQWSKARDKASDLASMTKAEMDDFMEYLMQEGKDLKNSVMEDVKASARDAMNHGRRSADDLRKAASN